MSRKVNHSSTITKKVASDLPTPPSNLYHPGNKHQDKHSTSSCENDTKSLVNYKKLQKINSFAMQNEID